MPERDLIDCPFCSEAIRATAKKCKHCGEFVDGRNMAGTGFITRSWSPGTAAVLALLIPGLGHLYKGQIISAFVVFAFMVVLGFFCLFMSAGLESAIPLAIPIVAHLYVIHDAYNTEPK